MSSHVQINSNENLGAREIFNLNFTSELVTLSACETGINKIAKGDELVGLTNSFIYAGAASLLVTLWAVEDQSTFEFMQSFYKYLKNKMNRALTLQNATINLM
jgi:CHAT domain-containing protein